MPRIYTSTNEPLDFCRRCFPKQESTAYKQYGHLGKGPDGRVNCFDYDADHPDYDDEQNYHCCNCGRELTGQDNHGTEFQGRVIF